MITNNNQSGKDGMSEPSFQPKKLILPHSIGQISRPPSIEDKPSLRPGPCALCSRVQAEHADLVATARRAGAGLAEAIAGLIYIANIDPKTGLPLSDDETTDMLRAREVIQRVMDKMPLPEVG